MKKIQIKKINIIKNVIIIIICYLAINVNHVCQDCIEITVSSQQIENVL